MSKKKSLRRHYSLGNGFTVCGRDDTLLTTTIKAAEVDCVTCRRKQVIVSLDDFIDAGIDPQSMVDAVVHATKKREILRAAMKAEWDARIAKASKQPKKRVASAKVGRSPAGPVQARAVRRVRTLTKEVPPTKLNGGDIADIVADQGPSHDAWTKISAKARGHC